MPSPRAAQSPKSSGDEDVSRFMSVTTDDVRRRYWRQYRRKQRENKASVRKRPAAHVVLRRPAAAERSARSGAACPAPSSPPVVSAGGPTRGIKRAASREQDCEPERSKSRHRLYPCCGRRRAQCVCDFSAVARRVQKDALKTFKEQLKDSRLLTARDTADVGWFLARYKWNPGQMPLWRYFFLRLAFRRFNRVSTWEQLAPSFSPQGEPDYEGIAAKLTDMKKRGETIFGGAFFPPTLKQYRFEPAGKWCSCARLSVGDREVVSLKLIEKAIPREMMDAFERTPSRLAFSVWYDAFLAFFATRTRGLFSDYSFKCALDCLTLSGAVQDEHISRWPTKCPGYKAPLERLFGKDLPQSQYWDALVWLYREVTIEHGGKLRLPEVLMHLCWSLKRSSDVLRDSYD